MPKSTKTPFDAVRQAFAELDASEKTAFVLEATFAAVGEGIAETGRRFSDAVQDIDDLFTADRRRPDAEPAKATGSAKAGARKKPGTTPGATAGGSRKKASPKPGGTAGSSSKTAGKSPRTPDTDDEA